MFLQIPSLTRHKASGQGVVRINGVDHYLSAWPANKRKPPAAVQAAYDARTAEWLASGRASPEKTTQVAVTQILETFWLHVEQRSRKPDSSPTSEVGEYRMALRPLRHLYANLPAVEFSPLKQKAVRPLMVDCYTHSTYGEQGQLARKVINKRISRIGSVFKWAVAEELVPVEVYQAFKAVKGLEHRRTSAEETEPTTPVALQHVEATIPFLRPPVAAKVKLQLYTGMRPGEAQIMRACDIDMSGDVWLYGPKEHKTAHKCKSRVIANGPTAQEVIRPWLKLDTQAYLFSPQEVVELKIAAARTRRKTPLSCGNRAGTNRKAKPKRQPGEHYTQSSSTGRRRRRCRSDPESPPSCAGQRSRGRWRHGRAGQSQGRRLRGGQGQRSDGSPAGRLG